jgi:Fe2+ transport system protein FeoA
MFDFRLPRQRRSARPNERPTACESCALGLCPAGQRANVLCIACKAPDAERLRTLGLFEGAEVGIVDIRNGVVLDIRGSRLALGWELASAITVCPVSA